MTETLYDYSADRRLNDTLARFPTAGTFAAFNDRMREIMASVAAFSADAGGYNTPPEAVATAYSGGVSDDGVIVINQPLIPPLPTGFVVTFRLNFNFTHPQYVAIKGPRAPTWLSIGNVVHPLLGPGGSLYNYVLRHDSLYTAIFDGAAWRLVSNHQAPNSYPYRPVLNETATGGTLTLRGEHINSTLIVSQDPANTSGVLNIVIPAKLPNRWPVWAYIDVFQRQHDVVRLNFDNPAQAAPVTIPSAGASGAVPAGVIANSVVYFRIGRHSPLEVNFIEYPRGVR